MIAFIYVVVPVIRGHNAQWQCYKSIFEMSYIGANIGINHGFQCSNIRWITRKVFEHKAAGRVFKHLPSDPANV